MSQKQYISNESAIFSLWLSWAVAVGTLAFPELLGLFVPKVWLPVIILGLLGLLLLYQRSGAERYDSISCNLVQIICMHTLGYSAVIMLVIAVAYAKGFVSIFYPDDVINLHIPYLTILILGPVATLISGFYILRGHSSDVCRKCIIRYGNASERGFLGKIFLQESHFQVRLLFLVSLIVSVTGWVYYAFYYVNVNINGNDAFFYNWIPVIIYSLSIIYLGLRYFTLWGYYYNHMEQNPRENEQVSTVRFLILCGDSIYLSRNESYYDIPDNNKFDTPADIRLSYASSISLDRAKEVFGNISNITDGEYSMRFMYKSTDVSGQNNVYHFICCLESRDALEATYYRGKWYTLSQLQRLLHNHDLSPMLATELHRLYTITMAWKTYDGDGRRLYKIKNYRPSFRLEGICDWDVDFNNPLWLEVARFNEDKPFYHLRRFFQRGRRRTIDSYKA